MNGAEIKKAVHAAGLKLWQVAEEFGCNDGNFSRKLRHDFTADETAKVLAIIEKLKSETK